MPCIQERRGHLVQASLTAERRRISKRREGKGKREGRKKAPFEGREIDNARDSFLQAELAASAEVDRKRESVCVWVWREEERNRERRRGRAVVLQKTGIREGRRYGKKGRGVVYAARFCTLWIFLLQLFLILLLIFWEGREFETKVLLLYL